ncbi:MAG: sensor histidine kinase [Saprospiraceae bacterium]|nr:sensor histidine kinase [Saprospiraceae bacterium]
MHTTNTLRTDPARWSQQVLLMIALFVPGIIKGQPPADSCVTLFRSAFQQRMADLTRSNELAGQALACAVAAQDDSLRAETLFLLGWNHQVAGDYPQSNEYFFKVLDLPEGSYPLNRRGYTIGRIGKNYAETGEFALAAEYLLRYDSLYLTLGEARPNIEPKLLLGELHEYMLEPEVAGRYYREAYDMADAGNWRFAKIQALYYLLDFHLQRQKDEGYGEYLEEYLDLVKEVDREGKLDFAHTSLLDLNSPAAERIELLNRLLNELRNTDHVLSRYFTASKLIDALQSTGQIANAVSVAETELAFARQSGNFAVVTSYHSILRWLYEEAGQFERAYRNAISEKRLRDSIHTIEVTKYVDSLNLLFDTYEKDAALADQELTIARQQRSRTVLLALLGGVVWFALFAILFLWNRNRLIRRIARRESELKEAEIERLEQEKTILSMSSMIEGQEAERKRIAQDLHDGLGGLLSNVKSQIQTIQQQVGALEKYDLFTRASGMIDQASQEVRRIASNMMPSSLSALGLAAAVENIAEHLQEDHGLSVSTEFIGMEQRLDETIEIMVYRIIQELSNNVVKHAQASHLMIQINQADKELFLVVEDDGQGFDLTEADRSGGVGLASIRSRVRYLKGDLDISSNRGEGTTATIRVPWSDQSDNIEADQNMK